MSHVALDLETTDLDQLGSAIVEVAAVKVLPDGTTSEFAALVRPHAPVSPEAFAAHGLSTDELLATGCDLRETLIALREFIGDLPVVAHNGLAFDFPILFNEAARAGVSFGSNPLIDTLPLARLSLTTPSGRYRLGDLCTAVGHVNPRAHRALSDAYACNAVFRALLQVDPDVLAHWRNCSALTWTSLLSLPEGYGLLAEAIALGLDVEIDYQGTQKPESRRWVQPIRFAVGAGGACYVVGICCVDRVEKNFRLDRITRLVQLRPRAA